MSEDMVRALLIERAGYERMGKLDRAAQVTEQLRLRGYETPALAETREDVKTARGTRTTKG